MKRSTPSRVRFLRASFFLWLIAPLAVVATETTGPYLLWSYTWIDQGQGYDPFATRYYTRCTYVGMAAQFTVHHPVGGKCKRLVMKVPPGVTSEPHR